MSGMKYYERKKSYISNIKLVPFIYILSNAKKKMVRKEANKFFFFPKNTKSAIDFKTKTWGKPLCTKQKSKFKF